MAVTTTKTNKPLNPRGNDQSPKGYNRASLFSGKALDFDGVNDDINVTPAPIGAESAVTFTGYLKTTQSFSSVKGIISKGTNGFGDFVIAGRSNDKLGVYFQTNSASGGYHLSTTSINDGEWYFFAVTWENSSDNLKIYINGILENTQTIAGDSVKNTDTKLAIGAFSNNSNYFDGELANFKIFNTALTAAQVADLYNNPEKIVPTGVADSALKLWLPMMEGAGTTAYNGAPDALGSNVVTNGTFDTDSDWTKATGWTIANGKATFENSGGAGNLSQSCLEVGKTYLLTFDTLEVTGGNFAYALGGGFVFINNIEANKTHRVIATAGGTSLTLRGPDNFNGSIDNVSVKELSNIGTISGATWTHGVGSPVAQTAVIDWNKISDGTNEVLIPQGLTAGRDLLGNLFENVRKQGALNLDGNSWAEVHDNASLDITDAITLEAWVYFDGSTDKGILGRWNTYTNKRSYLLYNNGTKFRFYVSSDGTANLNQQNNTAISAGWNHIVGVYDGAKIYTYLNGAVDGSQNYSSDIDANDSVIEIARYRGDSGKANTNDIAQPRIYNRALTAEEVERNYTAGKYIYTND